MPDLAGEDLQSEPPRSGRVAADAVTRTGLVDGGSGLSGGRAAAVEPLGRGRRRGGRALRSAGVPALAGACFAGALPPVGAWFLTPFGAALLVLALRGRSTRGRAAAGAWCGAVWFGVGLSWVWGFSLPGALALVLLSTVLVAGLAALARAALTITVPAVLVLVEALRQHVPFGGFPLAGLSLS